MYTLYLQRSLSKKTSDEKIQAQIDYIVTRGMAGARGKTWEVQSNRFAPVQQTNGLWLFQYQLVFTKVRGDRGGEAEYNQWEEIKAMIQQTGQASRFQDYPWTIRALTLPGAETPVPQEETNPTDQNSDQSEPIQNTPEVPEPNIAPEGFENVVAGINNVLTSILGGVRVIQPFGPAKKWDQLVVPDELLSLESDRHLANHSAWMNLYGVNPQIRIILSNIKRAHETNGESRNHGVLFGHAGCGKTTTLFALEQMFGSDAILKLDATSTTRAGLEKLFFSDLKEIPPLVFMEEAEKADPEALKIWLGALDDRGEIRKVNFRVNQLREIKVLFLCTVNNKTLFDKMMGSDGSTAGALSSRCVTQVYYPRPSESVLFEILTKEIRDKGGREEWISPAIQLSKQLGISDPRIVRSYLAGADRLLDGTYQRDWISVFEAQQAYNQS